VLESAGGRKIRAIAFRAGQSGLGEALLKREGALHLAVKLKRDTYGGSDRVECEILDGAWAG
jgi:single-stranded-DNA-specific exonuclease